MELPKNITQIGEVGKDCKIYVEDYVVSYMKQLNRAAQDKDIAVALYGKRKEENGIVYYFVYGACKLDFLQREVRHLSQAQRQEIEQYRKRYFSELGLVGYRLLDGDMIEGFHICEQDICRYISGYAQFYEKNDAMLAYMLDVREAVPPEKVEQEKYDEVKKRQDERRAAEAVSNASSKEANAKGGIMKPRDANDRSARAGREQMRRRTDISNWGANVNLQKMRLTAVGVFALLCLLGIATFRDDEIKNSKDNTAAGVAVNSGSVKTDKLVMEDKLEQALLNENHSLLKENQSTQEEPSAQDNTPAQNDTSTQNNALVQNDDDISVLESEDNGAQQNPASGGEDKKAASSQETAVAYVIQSGDTLTAISKRQYGTDVRVADICNLNKINNPDDIKEGQIIMLPR